MTTRKCNSYSVLCGYNCSMDKLFHSWFGWWFITFMLYTIIVIVYGVRAQTQALAGWWIEAKETLAFRKPHALRRSSLMIPGVFFLMLLPTLLATPSHRRYEAVQTSQMQLTQTLIKGYMAASVLGLSLLFVYLGGPFEMRLDGRQRVYEKTTGWPWRPETRRGSLDDYKGICVTRRNSIMLVPRSPRRLITGDILSDAASKQAARTLAEEVRRVTGVPIIDCPQKR